MRQPQHLRQPYFVRQSHIWGQPAGIIFIFALLCTAVISRVPHSWVYGSGGVRPVPPTISMSFKTYVDVKEIYLNVLIYAVFIDYEGQAGLLQHYHIFLTKVLHLNFL